MIEEVVLDYLKETLDIPCYAERPQKEPRSEYIVIEKTGSTEENHLPDATIAVQSYGLRLYDAAALNERVKRVMRDITRLPQVSAVRLNTDANFTNAAMKAYCYQAVFILTYYGEE